MMRTAADPRPPENVVLIYRDGRRRPVDCVYVGRRRGIHRWQVLVDRQLVSELESIECDTLPAKSSIILEIRDDR